MQEIKFYVAAPQTLGTVRDFANAKNATAPTLVRGCEVCLKMRLFANSDGDAAYPITAFSNIVSWQWAMDKDFNEATNYILEADNANITVATVTDEVDGTEIEYTEFSIPIPNMNTEELVAWLGTDKSKPGLAGELVGFDANANQVFVLQVENFTIRNRITSQGNPTPIDPDYLTAEQVWALIAAGYEVRYAPETATGAPDETRINSDDVTNTDNVYFSFRNPQITNSVWTSWIRKAEGKPAPAVKVQYSANSTSWHDVATDTDIYVRFSVDDGSTWGSALKFKGDTGASAYEVWKALPYNENKTESEFIASLKGEQGESALDAYKLLPGNEDKTATDFINSLKLTFADLTDADKAELTLKYSDLTEAQKADLTLTWDKLTAEQKAELTLTWDKLTAEQKAELTLTWDKLTTEQKDSLKLKFADLTEEDKAELKGEEGKSAYQVWLDAGNTGTVSDYLADLTGPAGTGLKIRGAYDSSSTYSKTEEYMDGVESGGSLWGYINATSSAGNAPPVLPATSNDYWTLLVSKGDAGTSNFVKVGYASDTNGTGFSTTPGSNLTYIAFAVLTEDRTAIASDFTGKWIRYIGTDGTNGADGADGADGASSYLYRAYASDTDGTGFSLTWTEGLTYEAVITTSTPISSPALSDFAGNFKKFIGTNGSDGADGSSSISFGYVSAVDTTAGTVSVILRNYDGTFASSPVTAIYDFTVPTTEA